jgi:hypothetical protein
LGFGFGLGLNFNLLPQTQISIKTILLQKTLKYFQTIQNL